MSKPTRETITVPIPPPKRRAGVMPTKTERDRKKDYRRKSKHHKVPDEL